METEAKTGAASQGTRVAKLTRLEAAELYWKEVLLASRPWGLPDFSKISRHEEDALDRRVSEEAMRRRDEILMGLEDELALEMTYDRPSDIVRFRVRIESEANASGGS